MSPMQRQEKHDMLQTGQEHYISDTLQKQKTFKIFHNLTCKSKFLVYIYAVWENQKHHLIYTSIIRDLT